MEAGVSTENRVDVTFAIACYNSEAFLEEAVLSALNQADVSVEVIIVDDGSSDNSLMIANRLASEDPRIKILSTSHNSGPGGARNLALAAMQGDWYAVLDSDDVLELDRSRMLIDAANVNDADMISDDLVIFGEGLEHSYLLGMERTAGPLELDAYFRNSQLFSSRPNFGFLKPMIRREVVQREKLRYDPRIRIGEDDELVVRLLAKGYRYFLVSDAMYKYRKHGSSISHRLSVKNARKMLETESNIQTLIGKDAASSETYLKRLASVKNAVAFVESVDQIKTKHLVGCVKTLLHRPAAILLYRMPIIAAFERIIVRDKHSVVADD